MERLDIILNDYKQLREESLQSMKNRNSILTFGLGVLGVVFHAAISSYAVQTAEGYLLCLLIFNFGIPALSFLIFTLWMGEAARMSRIGMYLKERELLINLLAKVKLKNESKEDEIILDNDKPSHFSQLVYWENYIREDMPADKTRQLIYPYIAIVMLFIGISAVSVAIAYFFPMKILGFSLQLRMGLLSTSIILMSFIVLYLRKKGLELK